MSYNFRPIERDSFLLPPDMKEWLPEGVEEMLRRLECSKKEHYSHTFDSAYDSDGRGNIKNGSCALFGVRLV